MKPTEQMKKTAALFMQAASDETDPEMRQSLEDLAARCLAPRAKGPPRRRQDCKSFEDACGYFFRAAYLNPENSMVVENGIVERMEWFGREFSDKHVALLAEFILGRGLLPDGLVELRLNATRITAEGYERLRRILPQTKLTVILPGDKVPDLDLAKYRAKK